MMSTDLTTLAASFGQYLLEAQATRRDDWSAFIDEALADPVMVALEALDTHHQHWPYIDSRLEPMYAIVQVWLDIERKKRGRHAH